MTISSLTSSSAISQSSYVSRLNSTSSSAASSAVGGTPPPRPQGGDFINAIASALKSIGVSNTGSSTATSDTSSSDSASSTENAAQALGSFMQELMGALHEQGAQSSDTQSSGMQASAAQAYGPPPGGPRGPGGPDGGGGKLEADLQSLISKLTSSDSTDATSDTSDATDTSTTSLESSFKNLLTALGSSEDGSDANTKLANFLQALSDNLPGAGSSGNLINTTV